MQSRIALYARTYLSILSRISLSMHLSLYAFTSLSLYAFIASFSLSLSLSVRSPIVRPHLALSRRRHVFLAESAVPIQNNRISLLTFTLNQAPYSKKDPDCVRLESDSSPTRVRLESDGGPTEIRQKSDWNEGAVCTLAILGKHSGIPIFQS